MPSSYMELGMIDSVSCRIFDPRLGKDWPLPHRQTEYAAALDLRAMLDDVLTLQPGKVELIGSGFGIHIGQAAVCAFILPRSGLGHKEGLVLGNGTGLIDADYQGELKISAFNRSETPIVIHPGDRIAQLVFLPIVQPQLKWVDSFEESSRGDKGFGHTGSN